MRTYILFVVWFAMIFSSMKQLYAAENEVLLINDISDEVQKIAWSEHLSLFDALLKTKVVTGFTDRMFYLSSGTLHKYTKFDPAELKAVILKPGDVVILGPLGADREQKLRALPELGATLRALPPGGRP